jgi:PAS domain S-box-containing protein
VRSGENASVLGFSDQGKQLTRQQLVARVHPDDRALFVGSVDQVTPENPTTHISYRVLRPDGSMVWLEKSARAFFDEQGKLLRMIGMVADITERKQAEEALRDSEARLRLAAQAGKMYAYDWDVATDVIVRSEEYANILGLAIVPTNETHHQFSSRVHPDDRAKFNAAIAALTPENPTTKISYRVLRPDGAVIWLEKSGRAFFDAQGRMSRMVGIVADITERKLAEEALRESEDKLRLLLDSTAEAIYGVDREGRCTFCNAACLSALGYERANELLGREMHGLIQHTRADGTLFPAEEGRVLRAFQTGERVHVDDQILWRANGTSFPAEYWSYPQRRGQEIVGAVVAFIDITQRKLAEAALANVSRRLIEAQEQERTRIARELHDDMGQRLALLANELEQLRHDPPTLPEVRSRIGELQKKATQVALDVQTLSHELHSAKLEYLGIAAAMRGFCQEFGEQTRAKIDFKSQDLPSPLSPQISLCLFRVLQEALHNSVKHSRVRRVEVRLWGTSNEIHLAVSDAGAGFDSEMAKQSRGLGLISMEERLKLLNGTLLIETQLKRGTTIHARVPISSEMDLMHAAG